MFSFTFVICFLFDHNQAAIREVLRNNLTSSCLRTRNSELIVHSRIEKSDIFLELPAKIVKFLAFLFLGTAAVCAGNLLLLDPTRVRDVTPETGRIPLFDGQQPTPSQG